jgi:hypothetical protein
MEQQQQTDSQSSKLTWYEMKEREFFKEQDEHFMPLKNEIQKGLESIAKRLNDLMRENQARDEMSKLKESEFYLDLDELDRLNKEADQEIQNVINFLNYNFLFLFGEQILMKLYFMIDF